MTPDPQEQAPDLDEIQEYCNAATAGPWILTWLRTALCEGIANSAKSILCYLPQPQRNWQGETDMKFCVNARTDLPALVKYTRSLQARLAEAECAPMRQVLMDMVGLLEPTLWYLDANDFEQGRRLGECIQESKEMLASTTAGTDPQARLAEAERGNRRTRHVDSTLP